MISVAAFNFRPILKRLVAWLAKVYIHGLKWHSPEFISLINIGLLIVVYNSGLLSMISVFSCFLKNFIGPFFKC